MVAKFIIFNAPVVIGLCISRIDLYGLVIIRNRLAAAAKFGKGNTPVSMGNIVMTGNLQGMIIQSHAITPVPYLCPCKDGQAYNDQCRGRNKRFFTVAPFFQDFRNAPCRHDEQADEGDISIAVGHGLPADLHNPYDRHKRTRKPQPPRRQIRKPLCLQDDDHSYSDKEKDRTGPARMATTPDEDNKTARLSGQIVFPM